MSVLSLNLRGKAREKEEKLLEDSALSRLAKTAFRHVNPPQYNRREPKQPLLKITHDNEKESILKIWRVMMIFSGDVTGNKHITSSENSAAGSLTTRSVMSRLSREISTTCSTERNSGERNSGERYSGERYSEERNSGERNGRECDAGSESETSEEESYMKSLPNSPLKGTLRRLRTSVTQKLFRNRTHAGTLCLPLTDSLTTTLDQVHYIVGYGILKPHLRGEIYCQICRQLVRNPSKISAARFWLLLGLVAGCFPPPQQIFDTIQAFVEESPSPYGSTLKEVLHRSRKNGTRFQPPAYLEIQSWLERRPIELQVTLMDGTVQTVVADGASTSQDVCDRLSDDLGLRQTFGCSLYISMFNKVASLGSGSEHVLDAISQCEQLFREQQDGVEGHAPWRLFYRKEMFAPWDDTSRDIMAIGLTFSQIVRGVVLGEYICDTDVDLAVLAARQYYVDYGSEISAEGLQSLLPSYMPQDRRLDDDSLKSWRRLVTKAHNKLFNTKTNHQPTIDKVKLDVVNCAKISWPMVFSRYYDVIKLEGPQCGGDVAKLAVNSSGIYLFSSEMQAVRQWDYLNIISIRTRSEPSDDHVTDDVVLFVLADGSIVNLESVDACDIRHDVTQIISGLRMRSNWAVVREDINESCTDSLEVLEGDLVQLEQPAGKYAMSAEMCTGTVVRTAETGLILSRSLYILPVLSKPSENMLKPFKTRKLSKSFEDYIKDTVIRLENGHVTVEENEHIHPEHVTTMAAEIGQPRYTHSVSFATEVTDIDLIPFKTNEISKSNGNYLDDTVMHLENGYVIDEENEHVHSSHVTHEENEHVHSGHVTPEENEHVHPGHVIPKENEHVHAGRVTPEENEHVHSGHSTPEENERMHSGHVTPEENEHVHTGHVTPEENEQVHSGHVTPEENEHVHSGHVTSEENEHVHSGHVKPEENEYVHSDHTIPVYMDHAHSGQVTAGDKKPVQFDHVALEDTAHMQAVNMAANAMDHVHFGQVVAEGKGHTHSDHVTVEENGHLHFCHVAPEEKKHVYPDHETLEAEIVQPHEVDEFSLTTEVVDTDLVYPDTMDYLENETYQSENIGACTFVTLGEDTVFLENVIIPSTSNDISSLHDITRERIEHVNKRGTNEHLLDTASNFNMIHSVWIADEDFSSNF